MTNVNRRSPRHSYNAPRKRQRLDCVSKQIRSAKEQICVAMRQVQRATGCATTTLDLALKFLKPHLKIDETVRVHHADKVMFENGGAKILKLNGCVRCHTHVYLPTSELIVCPKCHGPRFNERGQPNESCWYFPIRDQLRSLLKSPKYRDLLMYESRRKRNHTVMSDIYDSPRWHEIAGPPTVNLERIVIQLCVDGIPAHNRKECGSVKPIQSMILSLPPWLRYQANNMLVHMILPAHLKGNS